MPPSVQMPAEKNNFHRNKHMQVLEIKFTLPAEPSGWPMGDTFISKAIKNKTEVLYIGAKGIIKKFIAFPSFGLSSA